MLKVVLDTLVLTILVYFITLILSRILGRKLISQMTFFDFVVGIMIGSAAVNAASLQKSSSLSSFVVLIMICFLTVLIDVIHIKSFIIRKKIESEPVIVVDNGKIVNQNMKRLRFTLQELTMLLREKNVFQISDVEYAILEVDGKLSVLLKSQKAPITPSDMNISTTYQGLTRDVIIDGKIMMNNLTYINRNEKWLYDQLKNLNITDVKEVFYAGLDTSDHLYVSIKNAFEEVKGKYGIE